jgi:hypothetical protein
MCTDLLASVDTATAAATSSIVYIHRYVAYSHATSSSNRMAECYCCSSIISTVITQYAYNDEVQVEHALVVFSGAGTAPIIIATDFI